MYSEIVQEPHFYYDDKIHFYPEATTFIMNGENLKSLLLILNSRITFNVFKLFYAGGGLGESGVRYKKAFLLNLRLPNLNKKNLDKLELLYEELIANNSIQNINQIYEKIDLFVSNLYEFSEEEFQYLINLK